MDAARRILAIETSGRWGSAALGCETGVSFVDRLPGEMLHAGGLLPMIDSLLRRAGWPADSLTDVFVSIGPGSFTGLRIGVTLARTLAWSVGARIVAVPTVDCLARNALEAASPPAHVAVILDAKRSQIYTAAFDLVGGRYIKRADAQLADPGEFLTDCPRPLAVLGEGVDYHRQAIEASGVAVLERDLWPGKAEHVLDIGLQLSSKGCFTPAGELMPLYIRRPEAEEKWEKLHAAGR